jgi:hypothetical protein
MNAQHTADNVLIDLHTESQRDLLSNAGTTPAGITPFHCHDSLDQVLCWGPTGQAGGGTWAKTTCGTFVAAAHCGDAAEGKTSERWRNEEHVPGA